MHLTHGSARQCRLVATPPARFCKLSHNARPSLQDAILPTIRHAQLAQPRFVCFSAAAVDAEASGEVAQDVSAADSSSQPMEAPKKPQRNRNRNNARGKPRSRNNDPNRVLEVTPASSIKKCAYVATEHLRKHGSMQASAEVKESLHMLVKVLALAQRVMQGEDRCIAMLNMVEREDGGLSVDLALAEAQPLCVGTPLKIKRVFSPDTTSRIVVGKVASSEPCFLLAAGQEAVEVALQSVAKAQARLETLGFRIAVVPSYEKGPEHPVVVSGGFEPTSSPAPTPAADASTAQEASADTPSVPLRRSTPENSAVGAVALSVVLVEDASPPPPPAPSPEPSWVRRDNSVTALPASELEVRAREGAASTVDDPEAASAGPVTLEVTQRVQPGVLAEQTLAELKQKGSVRLSVDPNACGLALKALHTAGLAYTAPTRLFCDLAPSSRDGSYLINVTTASSLPAPPAPAPATPSTPSDDQPAPPPEPLGPLRVAASSSPDKISDALRLRLRVDGSAAVQCAYGQAAQVAFAGLVDARDRLQTVAGRDLGFSVEQCQITVQDKAMQVARLVVETWPL